MHEETILWVPMTRADLPILDAIADSIHPTLPERLEVFAEKFELFPQGCFTLMHDGKAAGYGVSHPWKLFSIPPLDAFLEKIPADADCLYMHDVAVLPEARGHNASGLYVEKIRQVARGMGIEKLACVSVLGTSVLWARHGFRAADVPDPAKLESYGKTPVYMIAEAY